MVESTAATGVKSGARRPLTPEDLEQNQARQPLQSFQRRTNTSTGRDAFQRVPSWILKMGRRGSRPSRLYDRHTEQDDHRGGDNDQNSESILPDQG